MAKLINFTKFSGDIASLPSYVAKLSVDLRSLIVCLGNLSLEDNVAGFMWEGTIGAAETVTIKNPLGQIPSSRVILRAQPLSLDSVVIDDSQTDWSKDAVYLRNAGVGTIRLKVFFMR